MPSDLLRTQSGDRYFDYCLEPYAPRRPPAGKLRSENLLWHALRLAGVESAFEAPLRALQASLGRDMIVWGIKHDGARFFFELYIYDPQHEEPRARYAGLQETLAPWLRLTPSPSPAIPTMMVSFDLDDAVAGSGVIEEANLYLTGTPRHEGRSYAARGDTLELRNHYRFLEPKREVDQVLALLRSSAFIDYREPRTLAQVLIPELFACKRICVAKKRACDGLYFSGVDVDQLLFALRRFAWPSAFTTLVQNVVADLDHLYFDVGVDVAQPNGEITYPKTSIYGTL